jgi:hypothetical protein
MGIKTKERKKDREKRNKTRSGPPEKLKNQLLY